MTKKKIGVLVAIVLVCVLVLSIVIVALFYGSITITEADDARSFTITASGVGSTNLVYFNMQAVTVIYSLDAGSKINGLSNAKIKAGEFYSSDYGTYLLFVYANVDAYVIVKMQDTYVIFNCQTVEETEAMYDLIALRNPYIV